MGDCEDHRGDRELRTTLPHCIGLPAARRLCSFLLLSSLALLALPYLTVLQPWKALLHIPTCFRVHQAWLALESANDAEAKEHMLSAFMLASLGFTFSMMGRAVL
eukprot:NODE_5694_length_558_cov_89.905697_g4957_i0.p2 GENE.NODE_5694_length_558_cov_89.905697_g4957_i0~~NODE_5694_length_558_cov_89.905697_g4957_i0.p2  ORF type:complete len:105 (+),score=26.62 NODE_5694_length_558_cov_89.905697_g4957_i0:34-348(+)